MSEVVSSATYETGVSKRVSVFCSAGLSNIICLCRGLGVNQIFFCGVSGGAPCSVISADLEVNKDLGKKEKCFRARGIVLVFLSPPNKCP